MQRKKYHREENSKNTYDSSLDLLVGQLSFFRILFHFLQLNLPLLPVDQGQILTSKVLWDEVIIHNTSS